MLVIPVLRIVMLLLLLAVLIDGATEQHYYKGWEVLIWDEKPDLPAGFFDLLRVVLSISLAWDAWTHTRYAHRGFVGSKGWTLVLALLLVLYQPIFPVQFPYHWWLWVDLVSLCVLSVHTFFVSRPLFELLSGRVFEGKNLLSTSQHKLIAAIFLGYTDAAAIIAKPVQHLSEVPEHLTKVPEPQRQNQPNLSNAQHAGDEVRPRLGSLVRSSDTQEPIVDTRSLSTQISDAQKLQEKAKAVLEKPDLSPETSAAAERARIGAGKLLELQQARQEAEPMTYPHPSENPNPIVRAQWKEANALAMDQTLTDEGRTTAQRVVRMMEATFLKGQRQARKPSSTDLPPSTKDSA